MRFNANLALGKQGQKVDIHEQKRWADLENTLNNNVEFGSLQGQGNIKGKWITVTTPATPNTDFTVDHNLGTVPVGIHLMQKSAACDVYNSPTTANTKSQATLRATAGGASLHLFIH